jgi:hypothetical protein
VEKPSSTPWTKRRIAAMVATVLALGQSLDAFVAVGIYNQFIYVNPGSNLVVAKISANHRVLQGH